MRIPCLLSALTLCAASSLAVHAQQSNSNIARVPGATAVRVVPNSMNFTYDAAKGITANGVQLRSSTIKSNSVSPIIGSIIVTINVKVLTRFEAGTTYHCSVNAIGGIIDTDTGTVDGGIETVNNFATGSGGTYSCVLRIPFSWTFSQTPGADSGLILAFGVGAVNTHGEVQHSTLQVDGIENLPAPGSTSQYVFNVIL